MTTQILVVSALGIVLFAAGCAEQRTAPTEMVQWIVHGDVEIVETIPPDAAIRSLVEGRIRFLKRCYEIALRTNPQLAGRLRVRIADDVEVLENSADASLTRCAHRAFDDQSISVPIEAVFRFVPVERGRP